MVKHDAEGNMLKSANYFYEREKENNGIFQTELKMNFQEEK